MICNYQVIDEVIMLHGKQIKLQIKIVAKVFKLHCTKVVARGKEG
jgi:hypothetical protein